MCEVIVSPWFALSVLSAIVAFVAVLMPITGLIFEASDRTIGRLFVPALVFAAGAVVFLVTGTVLECVK